MDIRSLNRLSRPIEAMLAQAPQGQDVPSRRSDSVDQRFQMNFWPASSRVCTGPYLDSCS
jgi:hypothetical protein